MPMRSLARRQQLLTAAIEHFHDAGYSGATTRRIAQQVGVAETVLFRHFPSKRDLYLAVLAEFGPRVAWPGDTTSAEQPLPEALWQLLSSYLDQSWDHRAWVGVVWQEARRDATAREMALEQYQRIDAALRALLQERAQTGAVRPELLEPAMSLLAPAVRGFLGGLHTIAPEHWTTERDRFVAGLVNITCEALAKRN